MAAAPAASNRYTAGRPVVLGLAKLLVLTLGQLPGSSAVPVAHNFQPHETEGKHPDDPSLWLYLGIAAFLVLSGGAFAGLTIALMGQDEIYLQVIKTSGEGSEKKNAASVLNLLKKGKHWVLVTLLLSNVITNETLPIVLDRSLGGGWQAILGSTILIVIFGEIVPQSICVRYGLPIGAWMAPCVLALMYIMSPVAWPIAKLLDYLLGEDHGTIYKKAGLKTLVTLHRTLGEAPEQLNADEVTIISAVLDLKEKSVGTIMTPMEDVFTMSADTVLDEQTMDLILSQGYSRIPIHAPDNPINFVGMLLVKMLITYDPEDCKRVRDFALATLPETRPETSCLDIVNFFQEGKSHMVLVSEYPGEDHGALGVVTLEDVIEELIGEEIIDESDVFVDIHKAIRRMAPAPKSRVPKGKIVEEPPSGGVTSDPDLPETDGGDRSQTPRSIPDNRRRSSVEPPPPRFQLRIPHDKQADAPDGWVTQRGATDEIREHLKHLGPSNLASRPRSTRYQNVKIKRNSVSPTRVSYADSDVSRVPTETQPLNAAIGYQGGIGAGILHGAGNDAKDGVHALKVGYGAFGSSDGVSKGTNAQQFKDLPHTSIPESISEEPEEGRISPRHGSGAASVVSSGSSSDSQSRRPYQHRGPARSGSITEQIVDVNGIRKVILHTTSASSSETESPEPSRSKPSQGQGASTTHTATRGRANGHMNGNSSRDDDGAGTGTGTGLANEDRRGGGGGGGDTVVKKKRRRRRRGQTSNDAAEQQPLLR